MRDLEAEMAKALEGSFFWEHTSSPSTLASGDAYEIMAAQRKFQTPKRPPTEDQKKARLQAIVDSRRSDAVAAKNVCHLSEVEIRVFADHLTKIIAEVYGVSVDEIRVRKSGPGSSPAKHHLSWALVRYFPTVTITLLAKAIERNHSTVLHSCKMFDAIKDDMTMQIKAVDAIVGMPG